MSRLRCNLSLWFKYEISLQGVRRMLLESSGRPKLMRQGTRWMSKTVVWVSLWCATCNLGLLEWYSISIRKYARHSAKCVFSQSCAISLRTPDFSVASQDMKERLAELIPKEQVTSGFKSGSGTTCMQMKRIVCVLVAFFCYSDWRIVAQSSSEVWGRSCYIPAVTSHWNLDDIQMKSFSFCFHRTVWRRLRKIMARYLSETPLSTWWRFFPDDTILFGLALGEKANKVLICWCVPEVLHTNSQWLLESLIAKQQCAGM